MLDRMLISGHVGLLAVPNADGADLFRSDGRRAARVSLDEVRRIFRRANDVLEMPLGDLNDALKLLRNERSKDRAVRLMLMALDTEEDDEIAANALDRLEDLLDNVQILNHLQNQFYSAPLPPDIAEDRLTASISIRPRIASFWAALIRKQGLIALNRTSFDEAAAATLSTQSEKADHLETVIEQGVFHQLAEAEQKSVRENLLKMEGVLPIQFLEDWCVRLLEARSQAAIAIPTKRADDLLSIAKEAHEVRGGLHRRPLPAALLRNLTASQSAAALAGMRVFASVPVSKSIRPARFQRSGVPMVTLQQLIEAGAHFGHQTHRWNPRMKPYIFGARNGVHILDLSQTVPLFARALEFINATVRAGGKVLFVGTKRQAQEPISQAARACGQHFVNHRWLGGMLTNWKTIASAISRLGALEDVLSSDIRGLSKREVLSLIRERDKLQLSIGGIRGMGGIPDVMFVIDANKEELAIKEANVLGIPVVAILDSNVSPDGIAFPVPGNDDASRAVRLYCEAVAAAAIMGRQDAAVDTGADIGAQVEVPVEEAVIEEAELPGTEPESWEVGKLPHRWVP